MAGFYTQTIDGRVLQTAPVTSAAATITAVAAVAGKGISVYKLYLVVTGATSLTFNNGTTALSGAMALAANSAITLDFDGQPWHQTDAGNAYTITNSGSTQVSGQVYYTIC